MATWKGSTWESGSWKSTTWVDLGIPVSIGQVSIAGHAPTAVTAQLPIVAQPAVSSHALVGIQSTVIAPVIRQPAAAAAKLTSSAPELPTHVSKSPGAGTAAFSGIAPTLSITPETIAVPKGAVMIAGTTAIVPEVEISRTWKPFTWKPGTWKAGTWAQHIRKPGAGAASTGGYAPTVWLGPIPTIVEPSLATVKIVGQGTTIDIGKIAAPALAATSISGVAPSVSRTYHVVRQPAVSSVKITGPVPVVAIPSKIDHVHLGVTGPQPTVAWTDNHVQAPAVSSVKIDGKVPLSEATGLIGRADIKISGTIPALATFILSIGEQISIAGLTPWRQIDSPRYPATRAVEIAGPAPQVSYIPKIAKVSAEGITLSGTSPSPLVQYTYGEYLKAEISLTQRVTATISLNDSQPANPVSVEVLQPDPSPDPDTSPPSEAPPNAPYNLTAAKVL